MEAGKRITIASVTSCPANTIDVAHAVHTTVASALVHHHGATGSRLVSVCVADQIDGIGIIFAVSRSVISGEAHTIFAADPAARSGICGVRSARNE